MAMVIRRYRFVGQKDAALLRYVSVNPLQVSVDNVYDGMLIDINIDNAVAGLISSLDTLMDSKGFEFTATISPKQVFTYTAVGGEANPLVIALPDTRYSTNYTVQATLCRPAANALKVVSIVQGTATTTQFSVELSTTIQVGDILQFTVEDKT